MGGNRNDRVERAGWNPWVTLRGMPDVEAVTADLPTGVGGMSVDYPGRPVIVLDSPLTQVERNAALAHELVHLERGWPCRASWAEEERVHDEVARRLAPLDELHQWVVTRELDEAQIETWMIAEQFHIPDPVAERAMRLLLDRIRRDISGCS